jgi:hypothetical protein
MFSEAFNLPPHMGNQLVAVPVQAPSTASRPDSHASPKQDRTGAKNLTTDSCAQLLGDIGKRRRAQEFAAPTRQQRNKVLNVSLCRYISSLR